jgi:hypothetical protein
VFYWETLKEWDCLEDLGIGGCVMLKWISRAWEGRAWTVFVGIVVGKSGGLLQIQ